MKTNFRWNQNKPVLCPVRNAARLSFCPGFMTVQFLRGSYKNSNINNCLHVFQTLIYRAWATEKGSTAKMFTDW